MTELAEAERFIWERLNASGALVALVGDRIFNAEAEQGAAFPYVIFASPPLANDLRGVGSARLQTDPMFLVKGVDQSSSYARVDAIATAIQAAINGQRDAAGPVLACVLEGTISLAETTDGVAYRHRGGQYRVTVKPST